MGASRRITITLGTLGRGAGAAPRGCPARAGQREVRLGLRRTESLSVTTTSLDAGRSFITLINVFTVAPENQAPFIAAQVSEYKRFAGMTTGAVAANLHRGLGGTKATSYVQFHSVEEMRTWQTSDLLRSHLPTIRPYLARAEPGLYQAVEIVSRGGRPARIEAGAGQLALIVVMFTGGGARGPDEVLRGQREAARQLLDRIPGLRSLTLHRGLVAPTPDWALYAQLEDTEAGHALTEDPLYRAWFTAEGPHIGHTEQEVYEVSYVQNEAALRALRR
jgi:hypothetical protein